MAALGTLVQTHQERSGLVHPASSFGIAAVCGGWVNGGNHAPDSAGFMYMSAPCCVRRLTSSASPSPEEAALCPVAEACCLIQGLFDAGAEPEQFSLPSPLMGRKQKRMTWQLLAGTILMLVRGRTALRLQKYAGRSRPVFHITELTVSTQAQHKPHPFIAWSFTF